MSRNPLGAMTQIDLFAGLETDGVSSVAPSTGAEPTERRPARPRLVTPQLSDDEMAHRLEATGRYRILRQLQPRPIRGAGAADTVPIAHPVPAVRDGQRIGLILDTETTGLDHSSHEIIELGMVAFTYDEAGIRDVIGTFSALREPGVPISAEITRITGITAEMVAGQRIDLVAVAHFAEPADLVIAHNARFDRPFVERFAPGFDAKPWACSVAEIDWTALGFEGSKLGYLVGQCGWFHNGHRAVDDCHALLEVLAHRSRTDAPDPFRQLVASAARTRLRLYAIGSPFHTKDILKARGYRWSDGTDGRPKCWWREIEEDAHDEEAAFLEREIYAGENPAHVIRLTACDRFKA